jgi:hypothetical protein
MIRRRTLCFTNALTLVAAGLFASHAALAQAPEQQPAPSPPAPEQPAQPAPPASPYDPSMQAGGLAPPPPMDDKAQDPSSTPTPEEKTEKDLEEAEEKDSGRGLSFFYLNVEGGFEHVGLQTFNVDEQNFTAGFIETTATGGVIGAGIGARLLFLTVGARGRIGLLDAWQLFSVGGELGFHIPIGRIEPYFHLGGGYSAVGSFSDTLLGSDPAVSIRGFYARAGGGLDFFVTSVFSIGASATWEFMAMTRPGLSPTEITSIQEQPSLDTAQRAQADLLKFEGSGYGSAVAITGVLGLHLP